jgi:hypothetical protein
MGNELTAFQLRVLNRLTTLKLAIQMLDRKTELSTVQRGLVRTASAAVDGLIGDLLAHWRVERGGVADPDPVQHGDPAASRRMWRAAAPAERAPLRWRFGLGPAAAIALCIGTVLLFVLFGAALLLPLLSLFLLVGVVAWLSRR